MARTLFGTLVTSINGKVGGTVYQGSAWGSVVRKKVIPKNPRSQAQTDNRNIIAYVTKFWKTLLQSQRDEWNTYAISPQDGYRFFLANNYSLVRDGFPIQEAPTDPPAPGLICQFQLTTQAGTRNCNWNFVSAVKPFEIIVDWGDGNTNTYGPLNSINATHTYGSNATFLPSVTVTDVRSLPSQATNEGNNIQGQGNFEAWQLYYDLSGQRITQTSMNTLMQTINAFGTSNGYIDVRTQRSGIQPTGAGLTAAGALAGRGWTVLYGA